ncbi:MAG TPA: response regulator [Terriglobia bacterium]|nr:response regulator [Terriglobia bacterium]
MSVLESVAIEPGSNPIAAASSAHASVLVIDDEAAMRKALSAMLQADGYVVVTAASGKEAVEQSRRQHFDLAITDLWMPEMDGRSSFSLHCATFRQVPRTCGFLSPPLPSPPVPRWKAMKLFWGSPTTGVFRCWRRPSIFSRPAGEWSTKSTARKPMKTSARWLS